MDLLTRTLRWIFDQPLLVQYALVVLPVSIGGVLVWATWGRHARLMRRADRAARRARAAAQAEGLPVRSYWVRGAVDVNPASLAITFHVANDATLADAEASGAAARLRERTLHALRQAGYPATPHWIGLVSDESVEREGGPSVYFR